ncbi:methylated-DNA--[protein]-cysteine S-methyltransferase [Mycoplasmopsis hyopharyngis]|uniref:methylated-DNA--[protein]-cysteine S-methyltransferase n=1 Tax=Mycoplasmopsis hyopharyngis TaxID=29558 RepID=UPI0038736DC4
MIKFAFYNCSFGYFKIGYQDQVVHSISFSFEPFANQNHQPTFFTQKVFDQICEFLQGQRKQFDFEISFINGTKFEQLVWNQLLNIPYGSYKTYKEIAIEIQRPKAYRAVGTAVGKNPIILVVPCHRVMGSNNKIGGYAHGIEIKNKILQIENNDFLG